MAQGIMAETVLQPSMHGIEDWIDTVLSEAECRNVDVSTLRAEFESIRAEGVDGERFEFVSEIEDDVLSALYDAGYASVCADDTLLIWAHGVDVPAEWAE